MVALRQSVISTPNPSSDRKDSIYPQPAALYATNLAAQPARECSTVFLGYGEVVRLVDTTILHANAPSITCSRTGERSRLLCGYNARCLCWRNGGSLACHRGGSSSVLGTRLRGVLPATAKPSEDIPRAFSLPFKCASAGQQDNLMFLAAFQGPF
jgi:hypothetical protein